MRVGRILVLSLAGMAVSAAVLLPPGLRAQGRQPTRVAKQGAISRKAHAFGVTARVDQLPPEVPGHMKARTAEQVRAIRNPKVRGNNPAGSGTEWADLAVQTLAPEPLMPGASVSFSGLSNDDNFSSFGFRVSPPDTNGVVGPNHFVQQVNLLVRVYNKAGAAVTAPFRLSSLFATAGICATDDNGDPVVMYDQLADRWILSQFGFTGGGSTPPYSQCIAVSQTADPAGAYYAYDFTTPGSEFPDYPKLGVWPDAYYMTVNQFFLGGSFDGTGVYAFDRAKMLAGDPTASFNYFNLDLASHPEGIGGVLPSWVDGLRPPAAGSPNVFAYFLATEFGDSMDGLRLFSFHADFVSPASATFTERPESPIAVAAFNPIVSQIPQPGTTRTLDTLRDRLMHRLQYRNTGSAETLVVTHTVDADPSISTRAGIRYYELRLSGGSYGVAEQATYSPDATHRWMGSAAEDNQGNLAVGYSVSSTSVFPGIRFAGRLASDSPGGLFQGESTLIAGSGVQTGSGRWGDYSALTLDPVDDCTFWYTTEYYTAASQAGSSVGWLTRVGAFKFPSCTAPASGTINVNVTGCGVGGALAGIPVKVDGVLYGVTNGSGDVSARLLPDTYTVTATGTGTASQSVTVTAGSTQDVSLTCTGGGGGNADLIVSNLSKPSMSGAGLSIKIKDTTSNIGTEDASATQTRFYLSPDVIPVAGAVELGNRSVPPLPPGGSSAGSTIVTIPPGTLAGHYFVVADADGTDVVPESDGTNNTRAKEITIGPDLRVNAASAPATAARGTLITVSDTTKNAGAGSTGVASVNRVYLSHDRQLDASDVLLGSRSVGVLAGKASSSGSTTGTIPPGTAPGTYYLLVIADATGVVQEWSETNNKRSVSIVITP